MTITVYSKPACVQCTATYRQFDKKGAEYSTVDISVDQTSRDIVMSLGHMQAPVVVVTDEAGSIVDHWSGFRPDKINAHAAQLVNA